MDDPESDVFSDWLERFLYLGMAGAMVLFILGLWALTPSYPFAWPHW